MILTAYYKGFIVDLLRRHHEECLLQLRNVMRWEIRPFTHHQEDLAGLKGKWLTSYKDARTNRFPSSPNPENPSTTGEPTF